MSPGGFGPKSITIVTATVAAAERLAPARGLLWRGFVFLSNLRLLGLRPTLLFKARFLTFAFADGARFLAFVIECPLETVRE